MTSLTATFLAFARTAMLQHLQYVQQQTIIHFIINKSLAIFYHGESTQPAMQMYSEYTTIKRSIGGIA